MDRRNTQQCEKFAPAIATQALEHLTIVDYYDRYYPAAAQYMDNPVAVLAGDEKIAHAVADFHNVGGVQVPAPRDFYEQGILFLMAYPLFVWLLALPD